MTPSKLDGILVCIQRNDVHAAGGASLAVESLQYDVAAVGRLGYLDELADGVLGGFLDGLADRIRI